VRVGAGQCGSMWVDEGRCRLVRVSAGGVHTDKRGMGRCRQLSVWVNAVWVSAGVGAGVGAGWRGRWVWVGAG
jgi:hypothetical protein